MNNLIYEQKVKDYKKSLENVTAIFESYDSEITYFQKNHIPWITKAKELYCIDLNEKYLLFANGNVAFLSKNIINEGEVWDWIKNAASKTGEVLKDGAMLFIGAGKHAITAILDAFVEIPKLFTSPSQVDFSKIVLGFAGISEVIALVSAFIPGAHNIGGAFGIFGSILFLISGIIELTQSKDSILKDGASENVMQKFQSGINHVIMGAVSIMLSGLVLLTGGPTFTLIKNSIEKTLSTCWKPIQKGIAFIIQKLKSGGLKHTTEHKIEHFGAHYIAATVAYCFGKSGKKLTEAENTKNEKSIFDIFSVDGLKKIIEDCIKNISDGISNTINSVKNVFNFNENLRKWATEFFNTLKEKIQKVIESIKNTFSSIFDFIKNVVTLISDYVKAYIDLKIEYGKKAAELINPFKQSENSNDTKKIELLKKKSEQVKEKIGKNDKGQNIQYVGKVKFDSNKIITKKDEKGNKYSVVTDLETGKKYGVVRNSDGTYSFRKKTNESKHYIFNFEQFLLEHANI